MSADRTSSPSRCRFGGRARDWLWLSAYAVATLGPCAILVTRAVLGGGDGLWESTSTRTALLARSVLLCGAVAGATTVVGVLAATALWRLRGRVRLAVAVLLLVAAPMPPYLHALIWSTVLSRLGGLLGCSGLVSMGWAPTFWVQSMTLLPVSVGLCVIAMLSVDPALVAAGRVFRSDSVVLSRIVLPQAAPVLLAAFAVVMALGLLDYTVPSLFGLTVYALDVFSEYSVTADTGRATLTALPLVAVAALVLLVGQRFFRTQGAATPLMEPWDIQPRFPGWLSALQGVAGIVVLLQLVVPLLGVAVAAGSPGAVVESVRSAQAELRTTLAVAAVAALISMPLSIGVAWTLRSRESSARWLLVTAPLAIPAPLVGMGLIEIFNHPGLSWAYDSLAMASLAAVARFAPMAALVLALYARHVDQAQLDAVRVLEPVRWRGWLVVRLPLLAPGIMAGAGLVFALAVGELGATLIVAPPGEATLAMRIYGYLHEGSARDVGGLCAATGLSVVAAGLVGVYGFSRAFKLSPGRASQP